MHHSDTADDLYTEAQFRALVAVERFTDMEPHYFRHISAFKRATGGVFDAANYWTGAVTLASGRVDYHLVERDASLIVGHAHETRADALAEARELLTAMGPRLVQRLISSRQRADRSHAVTSINAARKQEPRKLSKRAQAVFAASEGKCHYCSTQLEATGKWEIEHKLPRALFGGSEQSNLVAACVPCNRAKRDKTDLEFLALKEAA